MEISYENKMNMVFDKPLNYKGIYLYPATLFDYSIFSNADEYLDTSRINEKNIDLIRLPYLNYMYKKSQLDDIFENKYKMLLYILHVVFKEQEFDIEEDKESKRIYLKVYQRTDNFKLLESDYNKIKDEILKIYNKDKNLFNLDIQKNVEKLNTLKNKMYNVKTITSEEFDEIRQLIMIQNDIKSEHYSNEVEKMLYEAKKKMNELNKNTIDIEDLISTVSYVMKINPQDMSNMTIRRFNRYMNLIYSKDDYYLYKSQELSGNIKLDSKLPYWINHYEPKGKFDDILIENSTLLSSFNGDNKI